MDCNVVRRVNEGSYGMVRTFSKGKAYLYSAFRSACHLKMRGDRLTQGRRSMVIDYYWTISNVNCKPTTTSITPH